MSSHEQFLLENINRLSTTTYKKLYICRKSAPDITYRSNKTMQLHLALLSSSIQT